MRLVVQPDQVSSIDASRAPASFTGYRQDATHGGRTRLLRMPRSSTRSRISSTKASSALRLTSPLKRSWPENLSASSTVVLGLSRPPHVTQPPSMYHPAARATGGSSMNDPGLPWQQPAVRGVQPAISPACACAQLGRMQAAWSRRAQSCRRTCGCQTARSRQIRAQRWRGPWCGRSAGCRPR